MAKRKITLVEFAVQVFSTGEISWGGLDKFLLWKLKLRPMEGLLPYADKIARFGSDERASHPKQQRSKRNRYHSSRK